MLAHCIKNDKVAYINIIEKLVTYYPQPKYWQDLLSRLPTKPGYSERFSLDRYRLKQELGFIKTVNNYMEMSQLALQEGLPAEAKKIIDQEYAAGILGVGSEAVRHQRLNELVVKNAAVAQRALLQTEADARNAKEGTGLVNRGFYYVTEKQFAKGITLMEQSIAKGGITRLDDAKLHLGIAYFGR